MNNAIFKYGMSYEEAISAAKAFVLDGGNLWSKISAKKTWYLFLSSAIAKAMDCL